MRRAALVVSLVAALPAAAVTGVVQDPQGRPIQGARVCHLERGADLLCSETTAAGEFELPDNDTLSLRAMADAYLPGLAPATGRQTLVLEPSPALFVRLVDAASGEVIPKGEVSLRYESSPPKGPFPVNRVGLKIPRGLPAGEVRLVGHAEGYTDSAPAVTKLEPGKLVSVTLKLALTAARP